MNIFEVVRQNVSARQAAEHYGIKVNRHGMACCPFHNDKTPSLKLDRRYYCFGCGEKGDAVDFASGYFGLSSLDSAKKVCNDFGLDYERESSYRPPPIPAKPKKSDEQIFRETCNVCYHVLCDYLHLLEQWKTEYAQKTQDAMWHPYFCEALRETDHVKYLLDILWNGDAHDRALLLSDYGRKVAAIERRISKFNAGRNPESSGSERNFKQKSERCL